MNKPFNWDDVGFNGEEIDLDQLDHEFWKRIQPIANQTSLFSGGKDFIFNVVEENNNNFSFFYDIIYKNPAYSVGELINLHLDAEEMEGL